MRPGGVCSPGASGCRLQWAGIPRSRDTLGKMRHQDQHSGPWGLSVTAVGEGQVCPEFLGVAGFTGPQAMF